MIFDNPTVNTLVAAVPSIIIVYIGYRRSRKGDIATEQSGIALANLAAMKQHNDNLQKDNESLRAALRLKK